MFLKPNIQFIDIEMIITNIIIRYIKNNLLNQRPSNPLSSSENLKTNIINEDHKNRFFNNDIEFFDSFYDDKFNNTRTKMKHVKKKTYFRDIFIFIDRIKNVIKIKKAKLVRNNL